MSTLSTEEHNTDIRSEDRLANSFRDPAGCLFSLDGSIYRVVNPVGVADLDAFMASKAGHKLMNSGKIVGTRELDPAQRDTLCRDARVRHLFNAFGGQKILQHERVEFQTYPYEWPAEMLHAAGVLTLNLAAELVEDGLGLKDGTSYNVLFRGPDPVFIDVLSFERREADDPTWLPYAQFVRTFVLPLLAHKKFGVPLDQIFLARRDGLEPEDVYKMTGPLQRLLPPFLSLVSMPTWLAAKHNADDQTIYEKKGTGNPEKSRYILESLLNGLRGTLDSLKPVSGQNSTWSDYMGANNNYSQDHFAAKQKFVDEVTRELKPRRVLDIGCNTGHFSAIAARNGAGVVAADYDPVVAGEVWRKARAEKLNIQPMVINLTRPTPGTGWRNRECGSFIDRGRGAFDCLLMLAVIHHMLVSERVPLDEIVDQAAELTRDAVIIEFVAPDDSMFRRLTRGRDHLHAGLNASVFEASARRHFDVVRSQHLEGTSRWLYLLRKK